MAFLSQCVLQLPILLISSTNSVNRIGQLALGYKVMSSRQWTATMIHRLHWQSCGLLVPGV